MCCFLRDLFSRLFYFPSLYSINIYLTKSTIQGVTNRCRLSLLTNSALVYEPKGGGGMRGLSQWVQLYTGAQINYGDLTIYLTYGTILSHCKLPGPVMILKPLNWYLGCRKIVHSTCNFLKITCYRQHSFARPVQIFPTFSDNNLSLYKMTRRLLWLYMLFFDN
jgi:hypothetical protein